jgi:uncharacterized protein YoaH (UPF0181 family)
VRSATRKLPWGGLVRLRQKEISGGAALGIAAAQLAARAAHYAARCAKNEPSFGSPPVNLGVGQIQELQARGMSPGLRLP